MNDSSRGRDWVIEAQKLLLSLRDIAGASITLSEDGDTITEINILAEGHRPPKQIVRDVRSALRAEYQLDLDYRKISVAQKRDLDVEGSRPESDLGPTLLTLPAAHVEEEPPTDRLRFQGVTVSLDHAAAEVRVELALGERDAVGEARGSSAKRQVPRLIAQAALEAVSKFLDPSYSISLSDLEVIRLGGDEVVVVTVKFYKDRIDMTLTGACVLSHDLQQSVVYATLDALNRMMGRLRFREPVEYEIRPTSLL